MKNRKIMKTILGCLYVIPFAAVLGLTAYATFNDNSYLSNTTNIVYKYDTNDVNDITTDLIEGNIYTLTWKSEDLEFVELFEPINSNLDTELSIYPVFNDNAFIYMNVDEGLPNDVVTNDFYLSKTEFYYYFDKTQSISYLYCRIYYSDTYDYIFSWYVGDFYTSTGEYSKLNFIYNFGTNFNFKNCEVTKCENIPIESVSETGFNPSNAFDYGIDRFNDLGFEKMGFMQYFTDLFVTTSNRYTTFINSYFNYFLLVTCVSVLPRVLYWFIEWSLSFTERFTRKD